MLPPRRIQILALFALAAICGCVQGAVEVPPDQADGTFSACDPLVPAVCALPFPSSFYLADADTPSGKRLAFGDTSLPPNQDGEPLDPRIFNEKDGFSTLTPMVAWFDGVTLDGTVRHWDIARYADPDAKTVLLDLQTGERVPHWVELGDYAETPFERVLFLRPAVPLRHASSYVVGIRGLQRDDGSPVAVSPAFAALRDGSSHDSWDVVGRRTRYEDTLFPALEAQGVPRSELQLAWEFSTVSREGSLSRMEWMRDDALASFGSTGPDYSITEVTEGDCPGGATIGRTVHGELVAPLYTEEDVPGTFLTRDASGMPYRNGTTSVPFIVQIPCSLLADPKPGFVLQYGHGLFGSTAESTNGYLREMAQSFEWVIGAVAWKGMSQQDSAALGLTLARDFASFPSLPERTLQGFVEQVALLSMLRGSFATDAVVTVDGVSLLDPERFGFYGNSQGGILGGAYVALSPSLERGVLGVPGLPFTLNLFRSDAFPPLLNMLRLQFSDDRDIGLLLGLSQTVWDPGEAAGWAWAMNREPAEGMAAKQILIQDAIGDSAVPTMGAQMMARAYQASTVAPQTRAIFGVQEREPGFSGSAIVEWFYEDGALEPEAVESADPDGNTHECPRRELAGQLQIRAFLEQGIVEQHCDGVCSGVREGLCAF